MPFGTRHLAGTGLRRGRQRFVRSPFPFLNHARKVVVGVGRQSAYILLRCSAYPTPEGNYTCPMVFGNPLAKFLAWFKNGDSPPSQPSTTTQKTGSGEVPVPVFEPCQVFHKYFEQKILLLKLRYLLIDFRL